MAISNLERISRGLESLKHGLAPYMARQLKAKHKTRWWVVAVEPALRGHIGEAAKGVMPDEDRLAALDVQALLTVMWDNWNDCFHAELGHTGRSHLSELREVRNRWAHQQSFSVEDAHRALDTMTRLLEMIGAPEREETSEQARELLRQRFESDAKKEIKKSITVNETGSAPGLRAWREVATPHPDVASGRYQQAEFAADLFQVISGRAEDEYKKPKEFFRRTYFTEGLTHLLARAWLRLSGQGGDPVVELQTNFGGGKTHSMLALYHLFGGEIAVGEVPGLEQVIADLKQTPKSLPKAKRAVLPCIQYSPANPWRKDDGTEVRTLWGEIAWQLGGAAGYKLVADDDRRSTSPGSEKLTQLFEKYGPALILIDEWVAYARQLIGKEDLPAGTFEANMTFVQALTEAAKAARNTLVVAAVPESDIEVGGESGKVALDRIRNVFGRVEAIWKPASASESFEIVRRRLFEPITDFTARDAVCRAFADMYRANKGEFPTECREADYEDRLKSAYPIHPELFDRLYQDWSTLERFQRTRGVLRLMAAAIHDLWEREDKSLLIMPSNIPLDSHTVRTEITRYLPEGWAGVIDKDVDGSMSVPLALDRDNPNLGRYSAARRVARTVFIGSAPSVAAQRVRGIEEIRIKLACVQPGESPATFGDSLRRLTEKLTYLYSDNSRYWFDVHPTVTRIARDRAAQFKSDVVEEEIIRRLRTATKERADFAGVHTAPADSSEVPDEQSCRLVVLAPRSPYTKANGESPSHLAAQEILDKRGNSPRLYRNMLVFLAPDRERLTELEQAIRDWLAWTSIEQEKDQLNLDAVQRRQVDTNLTKSKEAIESRIGETYRHLLIPTQEGTGPIEWTRVPLQGQEAIVTRASKKMKSEGHLIITWSPALLKLELDRWLWKDQAHLGLKLLWDYLCKYLYLPRVKDEGVLLDVIRQGAGSLTWKDFYAYASAYDESTGRYLGLVAGQIPHVTIDNASAIVKPDTASAQLTREAEDQAQPVYVPTAGSTSGDPIAEPPFALDVPAGVTLQPAAVKLTRFHGSVTLDPSRLGRDAGRIAEEVVSHLSALKGAKVQVTLEIQVEMPNGAPDDVVRIVQENSNTLKFKSHGFEEG
jgi:hypothetical protein